MTPRPAVATGLLTAAQLVTWVVVLRYYGDGQWAELALQPRTLKPELLLIAPFVHVHPYHLGVNLAVLWLFGSGLERAIGAARFVGIYLTSAWFASLMFWAVTVLAPVGTEGDASGSLLGAVGASGAIAGVLGAYVVRLPHQALPLFGWRIPPAPLLGAWLLWEFVTAVLGTARGAGAGTGSWAHFAGFVFGMSAALLLGLNGPARREEIAGAAAAAENEGEPQRAAQGWAAIVELDPDDTDARHHLVAAQVAAGEQAAAELAAREALARAVRHGQIEVALEEYARYQGLLPELRLPPGVRYRIGCWLAEAGQEPQAYVTLMQAAREDEATPAAASALFRAGEIAADHLGDPRRARAAWQRILLDYSDSAWRDPAYARLRELGGGVSGRGGGLQEQ